MMQQKFIAIFTSEAFSPDSHICSKVYCKFFQLENLTGGLIIFLTNNIIGGQNGTASRCSSIG
jgi:hypothetical protein